QRHRTNGMAHDLPFARKLLQTRGLIGRNGLIAARCSFFFLAAARACNDERSYDEKTKERELHGGAGCMWSAAVSCPKPSQGRGKSDPDLPLRGPMFVQCRLDHAAPATFIELARNRAPLAGVPRMSLGRGRTSTREPGRVVRCGHEWYTHDHEAA